MRTNLLQKAAVKPTEFAPREKTDGRSLEVITEGEGRMDERKINDVIKRTGIDPAIVHRLAGVNLNGISMEMIREFLSACTAVDLEYKPHTLGIIYAEESGAGLTHPFFILILDAFKQEAEADGYDIIFINQHTIGSGMNYVDFCHSRHLDGVCMVCADYESLQIKALTESDVPCVTVDHFFKRVAAVLSDNETGVKKLVEYVIGRGHRRIAFVHGHNNSIVTRTRIKQFYNTMEYFQIPVFPEYVREGLYENIRLTHRIVRELLKLPERPTCILLPDDICYLGAQDAAREAGLRIPDDISFTGYDGIPMMQSLSPKLTTIHQDTEKLGRTAAQRLIRLIETPETVKRVPMILPVELLEGGTVNNLAGEEE